MTEIVQCDGCGNSVRRETLFFDIEYQGRRMGGNIVDYEGTQHKWDYRDTYGDLCSECAADVIEVLNEVLENS